METTWTTVIILLLVSTSMVSLRTKPKSRGNSLKGDLGQLFTYLAVQDYPSSNLVCSPISALLPLGKLALGAEGETFRELANAIGVQSKREVPGYFRNIFTEIAGLSGITLSIASRIYVAENKMLQEKFCRDTTKVFHSSVEKIDFANEYEALKEINDWVLKETRGKIRDLLGAGDINDRTSAVLVNAVYFSGLWVFPFKRTYDGNFYAPKNEIRVKFMSNTAYYKYCKSSSLDAQIVSIPYKNESVSLVIVLPSQKNVLPTLATQLKLAPELLDEALQNLSSQELYLIMPKFRIESKLDLKPLYEKLGIKRMFTAEFGLQNIVENEKLTISVAKQKAYIDVNDIGTEAAAASAVVGLMAMAFDLEEPETFEANRPFLYYVMMGTHQLFSGAVYSPTSSEL